MEGCWNKILEERIMKKTLIILASALVCLIACNKMDNPVTDKNKINTETHEITLTVSLEGSGEDTKTSYGVNGSALKCTWKEGDQLTLVTYDATASSSTLKTIDNITLTSGKGKTSGSFTGTITGTPGAYYRVIYPAVTQTESEPYNSYVHGSGGVVSISQGSTYVELKMSLYNRIMQSGGNGNLVHLSNCPMTGYGTITAGVLSPASLDNRCSVLKITATLPDSWAGKTLYAVKVGNNTDNNFTSATVTYGFRNSDSMVVVSGGGGVEKEGAAIGLGMWWDADYTPNRYGGLSVNNDLTDRKITVYYPYFPNASVDFNSGSILFLYGYESSDSYMLNSSGIEIARKTLTTTVDNKRGAIYTLNF